MKNSIRVGRSAFTAARARPAQYNRLLSITASRRFSNEEKEASLKAETAQSSTGPPKLPRTHGKEIHGGMHQIGHNPKPEGAKGQSEKEPKSSGEKVEKKQESHKEDQERPSK